MSDDPFVWRYGHWETALAVEDTRKDYGERRLRVLAFLGERLHAAVITMGGDAMHVISFPQGKRERGETV